MSDATVKDKSADLEPHWLHVEHEDGEIRLIVSRELWAGASVGATVAIPDDLSSPDAAASGFLKIDF